MTTTSTSTPFQLPETWSGPEIVEDVIVVDDHLSIHRAGLCTQRVGEEGEEVVGSAADPNGSALARGWFELLERVSALEALRLRCERYEVKSCDGSVVDSLAHDNVFLESALPDRFRYARSNGVALHVDWRTACQRALWELAERDRVLRAWHGELAPARLKVDLGSTPLARTKSYEWCVYSFPEIDDRSFSQNIDVVGVFGFPTCDEVPFVLGLAGRREMLPAFHAAAAEALQLLAFLWGEPLPEELPIATSPPSPMHHLETYQVKGQHAVVRAWLERAHVQYWPGPTHRKPQPRGGGGQVGFVDLTPPWLLGGLRVAKAVCTEATPLVFGASPLAAHLPVALQLHPIP